MGTASSPSLHPAMRAMRFPRTKMVMLLRGALYCSLLLAKAHLWLYPAMSAVRFPGTDRWLCCYEMPCPDRWRSCYETSCTDSGYALLATVVCCYVRATKSPVPKVGMPVLRVGMGYDQVDGDRALG